MWQGILWSLEFMDCTDLAAHLPLHVCLLNPHRGCVQETLETSLPRATEAGVRVADSQFKAEICIYFSTLCILPPGDLEDITSFLKAVSLWWTENGAHDLRNTGHVA